MYGSEAESPQVAILTSEMFEDDEVFYPQFRLNQAGIDARVISLIESPLFILSRRGRPVKTYDSAGGANPEEFDALIIPGGLAPYMVRKSEAALDFVRHFMAADKPVLVIREGMLVLISADSLDGRSAAADWSIEEDVVAGSRFLGDVNWVDRNVVVDGNLITTRSNESLPDILTQLISSLSPSGMRPGIRSRMGPRAGMRTGTRTAPRPMASQGPFMGPGMGRVRSGPRGYRPEDYRAEAYY